MTYERFMILWKPAAFRPFLKHRPRFWDFSAEDNQGPSARQVLLWGGGCRLPGYWAGTTACLPSWLPTPQLPWQVLWGKPHQVCEGVCILKEQGFAGEHKKMKSTLPSSQELSRGDVLLFKPFCTPPMEKSDGSTWVLSAKGQVWALQVRVCMDRHCIWALKQPEMRSSRYSHCSGMATGPYRCHLPMWQAILLLLDCN